MKFLRRKPAARYLGCSELSCRVDSPHRRCAYCATNGKWAPPTCNRSIFIDPTTLKRRLAFICREHYDDPLFNKRQDALRKKRTERDWSEMSVPIESDRILTETLPEQYAGPTRAALRAFMESGASTAVVPGSDPSTLQEAIRNLGLSDQVYAELRDDQTVLRRPEAVVD